MGTAKSILFNVVSVIMIVSGVISLAAGALILRERLEAPGAVLTLSLISAVLTLFYSVLNIIAGISGIRNYNRRTNSAVIIRLPEISIFLCLLCIIISFINGILFWHILIIIVTGLAIPVLFIYATVQKSYN